MDCGGFPVASSDGFCALLRCGSGVEACGELWVTTTG